MLTIQSLLNYPLFHSVLVILAVACWVILLWLSVILLIHTAAVLGQRTIMYGKKAPDAAWNKRFYSSWAILVTIIVGIGLWLGAQLS